METKAQRLLQLSIICTFIYIYVWNISIENGTSVNN